MVVLQLQQQPWMPYQKCNLDALERNPSNLIKSRARLFLSSLNSVQHSMSKQTLNSYCHHLLYTYGRILPIQKTEH